MLLRSPAPALLVAVLFGHAAHAEVCDGPLGQAEVVGCALSASLDVRRARQELKVIAGRRISAGLWLPSNPIVAATLSARWPPAGAAAPAAVLNWSATLEQQLEIGGQRGARVAETDAEAAAQIRRVAVSEQEVSATALRAYFELLAARSEVETVDKLAAVARALSSFAEERARSALMAPVDADLIMAEGIRVGVVRVEVERRRAAADAVLLTLLGRDPTVQVELAGPLEMTWKGASTTSPDEVIKRALLLRGEVAAFEAERLVAQHQLSAWRRARVPNLTISVFAQRDGFDEQVAGAGLSLPIPLPAPVGHTFAGQIAESRGRVEQAETSLEQIRRRVRQEVVTALSNERARAAALVLYDPSFLARARADIEALRDGISSRQLSVRDALVAERSLIELLLGELEARLALTLARVELMRALGASFSEVP